MVGLAGAAVAVVDELEVHALMPYPPARPKRRAAAMVTKTNTSR
jgi:hypothetical protein